jgi:hypothetical protein
LALLSDEVNVPSVVAPRDVALGDIEANWAWPPPPLPDDEVTPRAKIKIVALDALAQALRIRAL